MSQFIPNVWGEITIIKAARSNEWAPHIHFFPPVTYPQIDHPTSTQSSGMSSKMSGPCSISPKGRCPPHVLSVSETSDRSCSSFPSRLCYWRNSPKTGDLPFSPDIGSMRRFPCVSHDARPVLSRLVKKGSEADFFIFSFFFCFCFSFCFTFQGMLLKELDQNGCLKVTWLASISCMGP